MESNPQYDERLLKYLLQESNLEENQWVKNWVNESEQNREYLKKLESTLLLVKVGADAKTINPEEEWEKFRDSKSKASTLYAVEGYPDSEVMMPEESSATSKKVFRWIAVSAAAAVLFFAVFQAWRLWGNKDSAGGIANKQNSTAEKIDPLLAVLVHEENTTNQVKDIRFPDGTQVVLYPQSEVTYREPATRKKRLVELKGKANFKVAKDKTRPFTVSNGHLSTTALGTQFTVTEVPGGKEIIVRLCEGRVVVREMKETAAKKMKDAYLIEGQELVYNIQKQTAEIRLFQKKNHVAKAVKTPTPETLSLPKYGTKKSWFMFNNQPLTEIFDALGGMYGTRIIYSKKEIQKMYFIGTFDKSDSIEYILRQIALINNLTIKKDSTGFTVKKASK